MTEKIKSAPEHDLTGRVALVVGASRGIGAEIARDIGRRGGRVIAVARSTEALNQVCKDIIREGGEAHAIAVDVTDPVAIKESVRDIHSRVGPIEILIYATGVAAVGPFESLDDDVWLQLYTVNVLGAVRYARAVLPEMRSRGWGRIVVVASTAAKYGSRFQSPYNASKHALLGFVRCLALETAAQGITVNAVCPGFVDTDMVRAVMLPEHARLLGVDKDEVMKGLLDRVPTGQVLTVEEVSAMTVFLLSKAARNITGQGLTIDGGMILI